MPRFVVERSFPDGLELPVDATGAQVAGGIVTGNSAEGVTWIHSYVSADKRATFCVYDAPDAEAIRRAGGTNQLPVGRITEVRVFDPYFYH